MTALAGASIENFTRKPDPAILATLVYGADTGAVRERTSAIVRSVAGSLDDPFAVARLSDDQLAADPARLADEFAALSLTGGRRVVWVTEAGGAFLKAIGPIIERGDPGNLVVAEAGALQKKSALRALFERAAHAVVIPCYADGARDIDALISTEMRTAGLAIEDDARQHLAGLIGADRGVSRQELAKLVTYCQGRQTVSLADVEAICGDASGHSLEDMVDAVFDGDLDNVDAIFASLLEAGTAPDRMLSWAGQHAARLAGLRIAVDAGRRAEDAVRNARPQIFFMRQAGTIRQIGAWDLQSLRDACASIASATLQSRGQSALDEAIVSRCLLALARKARASRTRLN